MHDKKRKMSTTCHAIKLNVFCFATHKTMIKNIFLSSLVLLALASASDAFVSTSRGSSSHAGKIIIIRSSQSSKEWNPNCSIQQEVNQQHHPALLNIRGGGIISDSCTRLSFAINPSIASLMAGSIAGAIGVGVAFPLDTLKTKSQVLGQQSDVATSASASASGGGGASAAMSGEEVSQMNMLQLISVIYQMEGIQGFYGGVKGMMVGQGSSNVDSGCSNVSCGNVQRTHFLNVLHV